MAAKDLITLDRAKLANVSITDSSQDGLLQALVTAYSDAIEKHCRRRFLSQPFDELYNGNADRRFLHRQYPNQAVASVRYRPVTVLKVQNTATQTNQQARVSVTSAGLSLVRVGSGLKTTDVSVTFAGNVTLQAMASAVNLLGNGWSAQVQGDAGAGPGQTGDYGLWPSADLYVPGSYGDTLEGLGTLQSQGAQTARGQYAELKMHTYELSGYQWDARGWLLRAIPYTDPELLHPEDLVWPVGVNNFRVQYTAGYSVVPEAVQEACARWVAYAYFIAQRDPALSHQVPASGATQGWGPITGRFGPPADVQALLAPYRRRSIATDQG